MHDYSLDTPIRRYAHVGIALTSLAVPGFLSWIAQHIGGLAFTVSFGATFATFYFLFDRYVWRWGKFFYPMPDLNGEWIAEGTSSYQDPVSGENVKFKMDVKVKQTFSQIEFFTETKDSTSRSFMAAIELVHAVPILRYGFDNTPKNMSDATLQRHPGMMEFRINSDDELVGDYFSGKHRLRYGELIMRRR